MDLNDTKILYTDRLCPAAEHCGGRRQDDKILRSHFSSLQISACGA